MRFREIGSHLREEKRVLHCGMLLLGILISALFTLFAVNKFVRMNTTKINLY